MFSFFVIFSAFMFFFLITTYWSINRTLANKNKAAAILKEKEQLYSGLFYKSPVMLSLVEAASGKIIDINERALDFFGHTREQVIGTITESAAVFMDPSTRPAILRQIAQDQLAQDQKVAQFETQVKARNQSRDVIYNIEKVELGNQECFLLAFEDITERNTAEKKRKESETLFSTIFYKSPIMKSISEVSTGAYLDVNENYAHFFGYEKEEFIGKTSSALNIWKKDEDRIALITELRKKGTVKAFELEARIKSGELRHVSIHADLVQLENKECLVGAFIDITEQKKAGELIKSLNLSLEKSMAKRLKEIADYKYALDQSSIVAIADKNGIIVFANDNYCAISGYTQEELIGAHYSITDYGEYPEQFLPYLWETVSSGKIWKGELKSKTKSGTFYWTDATIIPILDETGTPYQYMTIRWDITAKKNTEAALLQAFDELRKSEARLKQAQALSHLGSWEYTFETQELIWSDEIYRILGTTPAETEASFPAYLQFIHPEDSAMVEKITRETIASTRTSCQYYCRIVLPNGDIKYLFHEFTKEPSVPGQPDKLLGIIQDVSNESRAQLEKERITSDLLQRNKDLEQFAYIVSHNLRAPVANIIGLSNLMRTLAPGTPTFFKSMEGLQISVNKLDAVINDLNDVLQIRQEVNERKEHVNLHQLVEDIKTMTSGLMAKENVSISTNFSDVDKLYTIKSYLHSIFSNLISNSIKYRQVHQVPSIEILSYKKDGKKIITFRDNGLGIDLKTHQHKIFGLYKRFHFHTDGKGMGLFMVKTQVEALGGKIHVQSQINQGTEFSIEFDEAYT
jgi:PAS domain S-box-containing protein